MTSESDNSFQQTHFESIKLVTKMHSITIIALIASAVSANCEIFPNNTNLFANYPALCAELNSSMFSLIEDFISGTPSTSRSKRSTKDYTFSFNLTQSDVINLNFTLNLEPDQNASKWNSIQNSPHRLLHHILPIHEQVLWIPRRVRFDRREQM